MVLVSSAGFWFFVEGIEPIEPIEGLTLVPCFTVHFSLFSFHCSLSSTMTRNDVRELMHKYDANFDGKPPYCSRHSQLVPRTSFSPPTCYSCLTWFALATIPGQIDYREFLEAFASGRDGQGMMQKGARSLRPGKYPTMVSSSLFVWCKFSELINTSSFDCVEV